MPEHKYARKAFIKDVFLELPDYKFNHNPIEGPDLGEDSDEIFIGRKKIESQLLNILKYGGLNGSYLVTGYRGMGKTSFVKRAIKIYANYRKKTKRNKGAISNHIREIKISFAQNDLNDKDILKQITTNLIQHCRRNWFIKFSSFFGPLSSFVLSVLVFFVLIFFPFVQFKTIYKDSQKNSQIELHDIKGQINMTVNKDAQEIISTDEEKYSFINLFHEIRQKLVYGELDDKFGALLLIILLGVMSAALFRLGIRLVEEILKRTELFYLSRFLVEKTIKERELYKRLVELEDKIYASITKEQGFQTLGEKILVSFTDKSTKTYPVLNSKEIENELISILDGYSKFERYINEFIVVFDELDKVEPNLGKGFYNEKEDVILNDNFANTSMSHVKKRRTAIINILSSLKYFVTEAKAKFIFIAGREMFDAALADIADRESFISSIFHQIIYVDSFLKESVYPNSGGNTLSAMAELYLSHILLPEAYNSEANFLKDYYTYVMENKDSFNFKDLNAQDYKAELLKAIYTLQTFVVFLTYRSNGSPKKMVRLIEEYIISDENEKLQRKWKNSVVLQRPNQPKRLFLALTYKHQYHFGFITYLYRPFLMSQSFVLKDFSDNILVSTQYLMDHILKYHPFAFSRQNLELIPEVFTNNRNPLFRYFIEELVKYLSINHLKETEFGIFDYKFIKRTTNEIEYMSKMFENELAALNFSLDEMFQVKHHLKEKIKEIRNNYGIQKEGFTNEFIRSISFLNGMLGDAYYFDQEYDNAIVAYLDGIQYLKTEKELNLEWATIFIVFNLKLGLLNEKMGNIENALGFYTDCMNGLAKLVQGNYYPFSYQNQEIIKLYNLTYSAYLCAYEKYSISGVNAEMIRYFSENLNDILDGNNGGFREKKLVMADYYNNIGALTFYKNLSEEVFSITRQQDSIFKLVNCTFGSKDPFETILKELSSEGQHHNLCDDKYWVGRFGERRPSEVEDTKFKKRTFHYFSPSKINKIEHIQTENLHKEIIRNDDSILIENKDEQFSLTALNYYTKALLEIFESFSSSNGSSYNTTNEKTFYFNFSKDKFEPENLVCLIGAFSSLLFDRRTNISKNTLKLVGYTLSCIADCLISGLKDDKDEHEKFPLQHFIDFCEGKIEEDWKRGKKKAWDTWTEKYYFDLVFERNSEKTKPTLEPKEVLTFIIFSYYLSGRYFSKAGNLTSFSIQIRKILQLLNRFARSKELKGFTSESNFVNIIESTLLKMVLEVSSWNSDSTDRPQIYKFKNIISDIDGMPHPEEFTKLNYANISNNPETREALLFFAKIKLRASDYPIFIGETIDEMIANIPEASLVNPHQVISSQLTRMLELEVMSIINDKMLDKRFPELIKWTNEPFKYYKRNQVNLRYINNEIKYDFTLSKKQQSFSVFVNDVILGTNFQSKKLEFKNLVINNIFSLLQLIQIFDVYTTNPYLSNSFVASTHKKFGDWLKYYELSRMIDAIDLIDKEDPKETKNIIEEMLGKGSMIIHDSTSHYQIALKYYHKAKEFHRNGKEYHTYLNNKLFFLEGSYDDEMYHFGLAMERQAMNSGIIRDNIRALEDEIATSPLLNYNSYANNSVFKDDFMD
ncbi:MAG: hypothetical protein CFE21_17480 [Bacteroidetes bacterium B1(2017)]|nr:MAG: hypothetical protein CFE21_17480 [Bacteroidetes bacterium B1(2017)]